MRAAGGFHGHGMVRAVRGAPGQGAMRQWVGSISDHQLPNGRLLSCRTGCEKLWGLVARPLLNFDESIDSILMRACQQATSVIPLFA